MKRFFLLVMTAATMLFASSCSKEQISTTVPVGEEVTVTLTADLGAIESRAISDGLKVNEVAWAIYTAGADTPLPDFQGILPINEKKGTLEVRLVTGRSYDIALFAYATADPTLSQVNVATPNPTYYKVDWNNKLVEVDFTAPVANDDDARDCFWHVEKGLLIDRPITKTFTLTRPLAQLNFGVTAADTVAAADAGLSVKSSKIVASSYTKFNLFDGACSDIVELTFDKNIVPNQALEVEEIDYTYIGTTYLLLDQKMLQDIKLTIYDTKDTEINTLKYTNVPFQRNYRTNILGALLTNPADFTIKVDESFKEPDYTIKHWAGEATAIAPDANGVYNVTTPAELAWIADQVNSGENDFAGKKFVITETDAILDLNGGIYEWTPIGTAGKPFKGSFDGNGVVIRNLTVKVSEFAGLFGSVLSEGGITNVALENVVIESSHYAGAIAGHAYADITNCTVDGLTLTVTPNELTRAAYDNGDKVGGIVGYVGEKSGTEGYKINSNTVKNAVITAYRDLGGIAGAAYIAECTKNKVSETTLTVDQETNHYGFKKANLGKIVGRILSGKVGTNTTNTSLKLVWKPADLEYISVEDAIKLTSGSVKVKGWAVAKCAKGFVMTDESNALLYVYMPKSYPELGARIMVSGSASTYGDSKLTQIGYGATVTDLEGEPVEVTYPTVEKALTVAEIDAYKKANTRMYTKIKGTLAVSGNYINIDTGASVQGSAMYPDDDLKALAKTLVGAIVYVEGYAVYTYSGYLNICTTKIYDAKEATEWGVVGDMTGWGSNPDITMYTYGDGIAFAKGVEIAEGQGFKIRANNEWNDAKNYGTNDVKVYSNMPVPVYTGGGSGNLYPTEAGTYDIYFDIANLDKVYVMTAGTTIDEALPYEKYEEPQLHVHTWRIVGAFNGWNPADDKYLMTLTDDNKWATIVADFASDTELKFVANGEWAINRGNGVTVELDTEYEGYQDGANIKVPAGKYQIKLNMCDGRFVFKNPIAVVEETITFDSTNKRTEFSTSKQVWVEGDITVTNEKSKSTSNVANYSKPARFYKSSKLIVSVPGDINQIVFDCNSSSYATALKSSIKSGGTVSVASDKVTVVLDSPATSFEIPELSGGQVRMDGLTVTYMKEM